MEAKKEEFIVTRKWLEKLRTSEDEIMEFEKYFPNGGTTIDVLNKFMSIDNLRFIEWILSMTPSFPFAKGTNASYLIDELAQYKRYYTVIQLLDKLPFNETPLVVDNVNNYLFYDGDVYVKGNVNPQRIYVKGNLKIDGKLTVKDRQVDELRAQQISASEINLFNHAKIYAQIKAKIVNLKVCSMISGNVEADTVKLNHSLILSNVDANEIINDGGYIWGDVNTIKIQNLNGGKVDGKITYKRSDEHK